MAGLQSNVTTIAPSRRWRRLRVSSENEAQREEVLTAVRRNAQLQRPVARSELETHRDEVGEVPVRALEIARFRQGTRTQGALLRDGLVQDGYGFRPVGDWPLHAAATTSPSSTRFLRLTVQKRPQNAQ